MKKKWRCSQRYFGSGELNIVIAIVAITISTRAHRFFSTCCASGITARSSKKSSASRKPRSCKWRSTGVTSHIPLPARSSGVISYSNAWL
jgi:hypothetical protein